MTQYLYRIVYKAVPGMAKSAEQEQWRVFLTSENPTARPYTNKQGPQSIVTRLNNRYLELQFKLQKYPLTEEWKDV